MGWLTDFFKMAGEQGEDMFPDWDGDDGATEGLAGAIRQLGRNVEGLCVDMSKSGAIDSGSLDQLLKSGLISRKEHAALMNRVKNRSLR